MKKDFYDRPFYTITTCITELFLSSLYFILCNVLLILFYFFTALSSDKLILILLFISLIPLGPSFGALYSTIGKMNREKEIYFSSYFWNYYKDNFLSYMKIWMVELITITVLFIDFKYFYSSIPEKGIHMIFILLIIISLIIGLYAFSINSRFEIKLKDLLVLSLYYMVKKFQITILKVAVIILAYFLAKLISSIILIFIPTIVCIAFFYFDKSILTELESKYFPSDSNKASLR